MTIAAHAPRLDARQSSSENELVIRPLPLLNPQMKGYGSYCPIAKAAEILAERWTLLVIRDLLLGARHFNDLRLSIPLIPPATLSKRLKALQDAGVIERVASAGRGSWEYRLTKAGEELQPFLDLAGAW